MTEPRKFLVHSPGEDNDCITELFNENDIRETYYPYWYEQMCKKHGSEQVDSQYTFEDCLKDWITVNWAEEIKSGTPI